MIPLIDAVVKEGEAATPDRPDSTVNVDVDASTKQDHAED